LDLFHEQTPHYERAIVFNYLPNPTTFPAHQWQDYVNVQLQFLQFFIQKQFLLEIQIFNTKKEQ